MLKIGLMGLGPEWETQYRPALAELGSRIKVTAVYDAVPSRADQAAADLGVSSVHGVRTMLERRDVRALLILDASWHGLWPIQLVAETGKPAYVAAPLEPDLAAIESLCEVASAHGATIMPEFRLRATPAAMRLRELTASRLGPVEQIQLRADYSGPLARGNILMALLDWCRDAMQSPIIAVHSGTPDADGQASTWVVQFRRHTARGIPAEAEIRLNDRVDLAHTQTLGVAPHLTATLECQHGHVRLSGTAGVEWSTAEQTEQEDLARERTAVCVLLSHCIRRVAGGLIPVPDLADLCQSIRHVRTVPEFSVRADTT